MKKLMVLLLFAATLFACTQGGKGLPGNAEPDTAAQRLMQGIWIDADNGAPFMQAVGDSIFYPDTTSLPVQFKVMGDTLMLCGAATYKYPIDQLSENVIVLRNENDEPVTLHRSTDPFDSLLFSHQPPVVLNQRTLIKRDSVVTIGNVRYHLYTQVNPTSYRVINSSLNDAGLVVEDAYHDNIVNINIFQGANRIFACDFRKTAFAKQVPEQYLQKSILSDIILQRTDAEGFHFVAQLGLPGSPLNYQIPLFISRTGQWKMKQ